MPILSHIVGIKVYNINNVLLEGATVTLSVSSGSTSGLTNSSGEVILNVANAGTWSIGEEATIVANKTGSGTKTESLTLTSSSQTLNITLAETSDLIYYEQTENDTYVLNFAILATYDGEKVTHANPLPVSLVGSSNDFDLTNNPSTVWTITRPDFQPDSETITLANGEIYKRTFSYTNNVMTARSEWVKQ